MERTASSTALTPSNSTPPPDFHRRHSPASSAPRFMLPAGWGIEEFPRSTASHVDRYYFEAGTGKKFRSLREVERHLNGGEYTHRSTAFTSPLSRKMVVSGGKLLSLDNEGELNMKHWAILSSVNTATSMCQLPDGWVVEEVPRRDGSLVDKYYYEPGSGQKFRSRLAVQKHLAENGEHMPLSEAQHAEPTQNSASSSKRNISGEVKFVGRRPPSKIKWVLASPLGNSWNPFLAETPVPDSVKQQWNSRFTLFMNSVNYQS